MRIGRAVFRSAALGLESGDERAKRSRRKNCTDAANAAALTSENSRMVSDCLGFFLYGIDEDSDSPPSEKFLRKIEQTTPTFKKKKHTHKYNWTQQQESSRLRFFTS